MTIRHALYDLAALLFALSDRSVYWSDALGYKQAGRRVLMMVRDFRVD